MNGIEVISLRSRAEIERFREDWARWRTHPNSDIDFYLMILGLRQEILRPHVLVVLHDGTPDALLVGRLEQADMKFRLAYATLFSIKVRRLVFIHEGFLGNQSPENSLVLGREIARLLNIGEADVAVISNYRTGCPLVEAAQRIPGFWSWGHAMQTRPHHRLAIPSTIPEFYHRFSSKGRNTLNREMKKLLRAFPGKVRITTFSNPGDLDQMFREVEEVAKRTYQRGLGVGFENTPEMRARIKLAAEKGWLRAYVLYISERPSAFWVGTVYQGICHGNCTGYDGSYARYSLGKYLLLKVIEGFCEKRDGDCVSALDFGLGDAWYKQFVCDEEWNDETLSIFAPTLRGLTLKVLGMLTMTANQLGNRFFERIHYLNKVKKLWRNRLRQPQDLPS